MPLFRKSLFLLLILTLLSLDLSFSEEDDGLPKDLPGTAYDELISNSPFRRLLSLANTYVLTGVLNGANPVVTVRNTDSRETFVVSKKLNEQGWKLVEISGGPSLKTVQAKIAVGKQEMIVRFDHQALTPESIRRRRSSRSQPGKKQEEVKVEFILTELDRRLTDNFSELQSTEQEVVKQRLTKYLKNYPDSSSEMRTRFAGQVIEEIKNPPLPPDPSKNLPQQGAPPTNREP